MYKKIIAVVAIILTTLTGIYLTKVANKKEDIKILVAYHKKAPLPKEPYYIPIHVGRAIANSPTKDHHFSKDDLEWLKSNMIGDDTGDNISKDNRKFAELTAVYWAWKNYNSLGKPKYIGVNQYRRLIRLDNEINKYDIYVREGISVNSNYQQYIDSAHREHRKKDIDLAIKILKEKYPDYALSADEYLKSNRAYFNNLFIMRSDIFFEYCDWIFSILLEYTELADFTEFKTLEGKLAPAFLSERLTGIFIHHKAKSGYKIKEVPVIYHDY